MLFARRYEQAKEVNDHDLATKTENSGARSFSLGLAREPRYTPTSFLFLLRQIITRGLADTVQPEMMHSAVLVLTEVKFHGLSRLSIICNLIARRVFETWIFLATTICKFEQRRPVTSTWSAGSYTLIQSRIVQYPVEVGYYDRWNRGPQIPSCTCGTPGGHFGIGMTRIYPGIPGMKLKGSCVCQLQYRYENSCNARTLE